MTKEKTGRISRKDKRPPNHGAAVFPGRKTYGILFFILVLQVIAAFCFCTRKTGYHYDEYYSYYTSNVTFGLVPTDREWKDGKEIRSEFMALPGEGPDYSTVIRMQSYDVHPPLYYLFLRTACLLTPGRFSKWPALGLNLAFFVLSWCILAALTWKMAVSLTELRGQKQRCGERDRETVSVPERSCRFPAVVTAVVCLFYGFNPAVLSGVVLVRMYMLLGLLVLLITLLHIRALEGTARGRRFFLPLALCVYLGFLTHYYFAVYLFFLAAAMEVYLLFGQKKSRSLHDRWKEGICYAMTVAGALVAAVICYPACLGHIFRGYRGTEAVNAFFDIQNTAGRIRFFVGLLNEYVFGSFLPVLAAGYLFLWLAIRNAESKKAGKITVERKERRRLPYEATGQWSVILLPAFASAGYFFVVTKTALLTAEEANRYQMPVYGLLLLYAVLSAAALLQKLAALGWLRIAAGTGVMLFVLLFSGTLRGLLTDKVLFLYEEDAANIEFARENRNTPVIYFYNADLTWMIWDDSLELMQYDRIYFVNLADTSAITDPELQNAGRVLVYCARSDSAPAALEAVKKTLASEEKNSVCAVKLRELLYCDLYELTAR